MDPCTCNSAHNISRCHVCETPVPPLYCDTCRINLCKTCVGEHHLDESKLHIVVPAKHRKSIPRYPKCPEHIAKVCELHCKLCNVSVCVQCISSKKHMAHDVVDILSFFEGMTKALQSDLKEFGDMIYPKYQEIASTIPVQRADLQRNTEKLISDLDTRGEEWHREIDNIVRKLKLDVKETESEHFAFLKKQEDEINQTILEMTHNIGELKKLLDSNDICLLSTYTSTNEGFSELPPKFIVSLPSFSSPKIDTEQLLQQFGSLTPVTFHNIGISIPL